MSTAMFRLAIAYSPLLKSPESGQRLEEKTSSLSKPLSLLNQLKLRQHDDDPKQIFDGLNFIFCIERSQ